MRERDAFEVAFRRLFDERFTSLYRYLDRLSGDPDLAADLAQEAFVRLHARKEIPDEPRAWLAAVGANLLRDERRTARRRLTLLATQPEELTLSEAPPSPDAAIDRSERRDQVRQALDRLPLRDREMLLLRHEGYSYREIATALGITETSIGTMLVRATEAFRSEFLERNSASE
jgi:RNA polymerase sigma-70 factor (ECF subfamily)